MSVIRFVHTDHLRLGSPLAGLADCPDWLRRAAAAAVRKSVANVIEAAIASRSHFLVIAGRITESNEDLEIAVRWLEAQTEQLNEHGIQLVISGHDVAEHDALRRLNATVCGTDQTIEASLGYNGRLQLQTQVPGAGRRHKNSLLLVNCSKWDPAVQHTTMVDDFCYLSVPGIQANPIPPAISVTSLAEVINVHSEIQNQSRCCLCVTAGSPQAVRPSEQGVFGCRLVEADPQHRTISARFCATDTFRYAQETIRCEDALTSTGLISAIAERSRAVSSLAGRTVVVDWTVEGTLQAEMHRFGDLDEASLLSGLRTQLQAGHAGVWPRRIHYSKETQFTSGSKSSMAIQEFLNVAGERRGQSTCPPYGVHSEITRSLYSGSDLYSGCDTVAGLELLSRVA